MARTSSRSASDMVGGCVCDVWLKGRKSWWGELEMVEVRGLYGACVVGVAGLTYEYFGAREFEE